MRTISLSQLIVFILICFLLFGDLTKVKKHIKNLMRQIKQFFDTKNRKKGT